MLSVAEERQVWDLSLNIFKSLDNNDIVQFQVFDVIVIPYTISYFLIHPTAHLTGCSIV